jgi:hypothetical protein
MTLVHELHELCIGDIRVATWWGSSFIANGTHALDTTGRNNQVAEMSRFWEGRRSVEASGYVKEFSRDTGEF